MDGVCSIEVIILVEIYYNGTLEVKMCDFQKAFAEICDIYLKDEDDEEAYDEEGEG